MVPSGGNSLKWLFMISLGVIWGSSFILMKKGLVDFRADQVAALRMFASFIFLFPFVIGKIKQIKKSQWTWLLASGLLGNGFPAFLFASAQTVIPSFMAGLLNSLTPVFTMAIGYFIFGTQVTFSKIAGVVLGLVGAVSLIMMSSSGGFGHVSWYPMLIVLATICYASSVNIIRNKLLDVDAVLISGFALFFVGPPTGIYLFNTDFMQRLATIPHAWVSMTYILVLALFGTAISVVMFNKLIKLSSALFASSVTYLIPIVALLWGLADSENPGLLHLAAMGAILGGVYLINLKKKVKSHEN